MRAEVALHAPRRAAALLHPADGRWPDHEADDRLAVGLGAACLGIHRLPEAAWARDRAALAILATGVAAAGSGPLPGTLVPLDDFGLGGALEVVPWAGPGRETVECELLASRGGLVPRYSREPESIGPAKEIAALALLVALAADAGPRERLRLALGIEGLLGWFRESDRLAAPRNALAYALVHADERLRYRDPDPTPEARP